VTGDGVALLDLANGGVTALSAVLTQP